MSLSVGIVGLPNVGKSTLFNALSGREQAESSNRPFTTIDPNVGVVDVPDQRLAKLAELVKPEKVIPAVVKFVDIAGLVAGAHEGEGLGNKFLAHIRETDATCLVVRCFDDPQVTHVAGKVNPAEDIRTVLLELILADSETLDKLLTAERKQAKSPGPEGKEAAARVEILERFADAFERENLAGSVGLSDDERDAINTLPLITLKPLLFVANVNESDVAKPGVNPFFQEVERVAEEHGSQVVAVSAKIESEIATMDPAEQAEFLESLGLQESNLDRVIHGGYALLGLQTFYTAGPQEVRAWTVRVGATAPQAAGVIHTDFEQKFIKAEVIEYEDFVTAGGESAARDTGKLRVEGKDYVVQDGDVMHFRHGA